MNPAASIIAQSTSDQLSDQEVWQAFRYHSRTFSLAASLLPGRVQLPIASLYLYCRHIDNIADERVLEIGCSDALDETYLARRQLLATLDGSPPLLTLWQRLHAVHQQFELYAPPLFELIEGAVWDLKERPIRSVDDLVAYSDLVGGSIGAMMLPFLVDERSRMAALEAPARSLGIAMQITNILRDVGEDFRQLDRIYLPRNLMAVYGIDPEMLGHSAIPSGYSRLLEDLMDAADSYYHEGIPAIDALPRRMRPGIRAATRMYREIMNEVRAMHYDNLSSRAYVPTWRKLTLALHDGYERRRSRLCRKPLQTA